MKRNILLSIALGSMMFAGCSDDFLSPKTLSIFTIDNVLVNEEGFDATLTSCASLIRDEYYDHMAPILAELVFSDVAVMGSEGSNIPVNLEKDVQPTGNLDKDIKIRTNWDNWWKIISRVNYIIDGAQTVNMAEDKRRAILGQCYFYRSYAYYRLTLQFGDVPLVLEATKTPRLDFYSFTSESILRCMKEELSQYVEYIPETADYGTPNRAAGYHLLTKLCLATSDFDGAIAAANKVINDGKHHLMTTRFGALADCQTVGDEAFKSSVDKGYRALAIGADTPLDVIFDLHYHANKSIPANAEAIYTVVDRGPTDGSDAQLDGAKSQIATMRNYLPKWGDSGKIRTPDGINGMADNLNKNQEVVVDGVSYYTIDKDGNGSQYRQIGRGIGSLRASNLYKYDLWTEAAGNKNETDLRHKQPNWWVMTDLVYNNRGAGKWYGKNVQQGSLANPKDSIRIYYPFPNKFIVPETRSGQQSGKHSDWYVFRLAETYLLRAEAYWWKGDITNATKDVNTVRERAKAAPLASVGIDEILDERARELHGEEPRKTELARISQIFVATGKEYDGKVYSKANFSTDNFFYDRVMKKNNFYQKHLPNKGPDGNDGDQYTIRAYHIYWPIPFETVEANRLGHINQTPGYHGSETNITPKEWPNDYK